ncbi:hypothetical protein, partial [Streptococcus pneumoniae]
MQQITEIITNGAISIL